MSKTLNEISKTTIDLILQEPFYGHFFTGILKDLTTEIPTMCVAMADTNMVKLCVNEDFWQNWLKKTPHRYGAVKHEILHVVFKHMLVHVKYPDKRIFNIAADIVVNQYIERDQLLEGVVLLENFEDLNIFPDRDVGYYYEKLKNAWSNYLSKLGTDEEIPKEGGIKELDKLLNGENPSRQDHDFWKDIDNKSQAERDILDNAVSQAVESTIKRVGTKGLGGLPLGLKAYLSQMVESLKPRMDWRRILRLFTNSAAQTKIKNTIRRPSKRYGSTPGIQVKNKQKLMIAMDTSGSVSEEELKAFFAEVYYIWRQGAEVFIVECDAKILAKYPYRGQMPKFVRGRGKTSFNEPIKFANEEYHPDAIIYFTDGYAKLPQVFSRKPILWMISRAGIRQGQGIWNRLPGRVAKM